MTAADIRLIATDLDGTFLGKDSLPSPLNAKAVRRAASLGIRIVFATGRPARWLTPVNALADVHPDAIASNGAVLFDVADHRIRQAFPLPLAATREVLALVAEALPHAGFAVEYTQGWGRTPAYPLRGDFVPPSFTSDCPDELLAAGTVVKLLILGPGIPTDELHRALAPIIGPRLDVTLSLMQPDGILELSAPGVSKASTLQVLLSAYGIDPAEVVAFGDMPNDLEMLRLAGRGFAMSTAHTSLLAEDFESAGEHDDSGVGRTIMALLDGEESTFARVPIASSKVDPSGR